MALHWQWDEKVGEMTVDELHHDDPPRTIHLSLYRGNAFLIMLHEFKNEKGEDVWTMWNFFADKQHMRNCLGLTKGDDDGNLLDTPYVKLRKIKIDKKKYGMSYTKELVRALVEAMPHVEIEVFSTDG